MIVTMIRLKNIQKNGDIIRCDYYVEDGVVPFPISVNYVTETIIEGTGNYTQHALYKLLRLAKLDNPPTEAYHLWY